MGVFKQSKYKSTRRPFGKAGGKHSKMFKKREKARLIKQEERIIWYNNDKESYYPPYQLIRQKSTSTCRTKIVVRRVPFFKDGSSKLLKLGSTSLKFKYVKCTKPITGYRIINLDLLQQHISAITCHTCLCSKAQSLVQEGKEAVTLKSEMKKNGLFSILMVICLGCNEKFPLKNSEKQENGLYDINVRAVWGSVASGGGPTKLNETLSTMNIPPMPESMFTSIEDTIGCWWQNALKEEMAKAGAKEKRIACEKGRFHEGVPAITVICDGGWSKRTHKHTYNASGGVGVIFGAETQELLYIGVRNKQCIICKRAQNENVVPRKHNCFANWKESSQAMEADIILNGFLESESTHGLRYTSIIADGDSSVYALLQEKVPVWGRAITKLECANHACKCLRANLEKLVLEKKNYKGKGKLTKLTRARLTTAVRCAIKMRSKDRNSKLLRKDILNSIYHVLGFHQHCTEFCKKRKVTPTEDIEDIDTSVTTDESFDDIFDDQAEFWKIPTDKDLQQSREAYQSSYKESELKELIADVQIFLNRLADKSERLIGNFTTNLAESWMAIRAKFDGGKVINRCGRGSWATRCYGGALRKNLGVCWSPLTFQNSTGSAAGTYFFQGARRQQQKLAASKRYHSKPRSKTLRAKRKLQDTQESQSKKARLHYGSSLDDSPDVDSEKLKELCNAFLINNVNKTKPEITEIQHDTVQQHDSELWKKERHIRLTSSNFGKVINRRTSNVSTALVKNLLYNKFKGSIHTVRGLAQEGNAIIEYKNIKGGVEVSKTGLRVCEKNPFLAAPTDGIVKDKDEEGLLEIKNFLQTNKHLIKEATFKVPNFCLSLKKGVLKLKTNHEIYYQIQGQLNIFEKEWCDFVLRRTDPYDIHIERIHRNITLWNEVMLPKLKAFYFKFLLPELALPRFGTYTGIRKPDTPWYEADVHQVDETYKEKKIRRSLNLEGLSTSTTTIHHPQPTISSPPKPSTSQVSSQTVRRPRRATTQKFVGRNIQHEWIVDEASGNTKWYRGTVLQVLKGRDGDSDAVYEVLYEGEKDAHEVENLKGDLEEGSLKFIDLSVCILSGWM